MKKLSKKYWAFNVKGISVAFAGVFAISIFLGIIAISEVLKRSSHQSYYLDEMNKTYRLVETGLSQAMGRIANNPNDFTWTGVAQSGFESGESFTNYLTSGAFVGGTNYYIVTSATRTRNGKDYSTTLHTYAKVSNVADYFAAISGADPLVITKGVDVSLGKIYAPNLIFNLTGSALVTKVLQAEFTQTVTPPKLWGGAIIPAQIDITEPSIGPEAKMPIRLNQPMLFPQVLQADLDRYETLANAHTVKDLFGSNVPIAVGGPETKIFPPGYFRDTGGGVCTPAAHSTPTDQYLVQYPGLRTCDNEEHIYYSANSMRIDGEVNGQVLFVSERDIFITGNLTINPGIGPYPGDPLPSSSTAHQAILITRGNVIISSTYYTGAPVTQTIQALVMAPHGRLIASIYADLTAPANMKLIFSGSMILGSTPQSIPDVYNDLTGGTPPRTYSYMNSLKTSPPPFIPVTSEIIYSIEKTGQTGNMY
ncbi:MAG: hypothetical protein ACKVQC_03995 [Elusimicrobiota bacterium]